MVAVWGAHGTHICQLTLEKKTPPPASSHPKHPNQPTTPTGSYAFVGKVGGKAHFFTTDNEAIAMYALEGTQAGTQARTQAGIAVSFLYDIHQHIPPPPPRATPTPLAHRLGRQGLEDRAGGPPRPPRLRQPQRGRPPGE